MDNREINILVATHVMDWHNKENMGDAWFRENGFYETGHSWSPTTRIEDAWRVTEKMRSDGWEFAIYSKDSSRKYQWDVRIFNGDKRAMAFGETFQEAICLAALSAVGVEVEDK